MDRHHTSSHDTTMGQSARESASPHTPHKKNDSFWGEVFKFALIALLIVFPIRLFVAQPYIVAGASMEPTFANGEYLIADRLTYQFEVPQRGDVVIFRYPVNPSTAFIKRIIALPGETIQIQGNRVLIFNSAHPEGFALEETYVADMDDDTYLTETLGHEEYFVMGDNRNASSDSRKWGVLKRDLIIGRAFLRLLPVTEADVFPGYARPAHITLPDESRD